MYLHRRVMRDCPIIWLRLVLIGTSLFTLGQQWVNSFGSNHFGQLGNDGAQWESSPVGVNSSGVLHGLDPVSTAAGYQHSLVLADRFVGSRILRKMVNSIS